MAKANLTKVANITASVREIDFVTRFGRNWDSLREIMSIMRPIRKAPGTTLKSYTASVTLQPGNVGEGEEIPYSLATVEPVSYQELTLAKYAKAVSIEAVNTYGAAIAVQKTDDAFLNELQSKVLDDFYTFIQTGTLNSIESTFQMGIAMAIGKVKDKFKSMRKDVTSIIVFVNTLDAYRYLGAANLSVQTLFGIDYIENFMGADRLILSSEIPSGKIIATPSDNIVLYYVDPSDGDFEQLGLNYTVQGETNLIGFHVNGNYNTAVGEVFALMGMVLWAEYLDGIAVIDVTETVGPNVAAESNAMYEVLPSVYQSDIVVKNGKITGTLTYMDEANAITNYWGPGYFLGLKLTTSDWNKYDSVKVGLVPSEGTGLVEIKDDDTHNLVAKITDPKTQRFAVQYNDGKTIATEYFDLSALVLEEEPTA